MQRLLYLFLLFAFPLIADLKGLLILGNWDETRKEPVDTIEGVKVVGVSLIRQHPDFIRELHEDYIDLPFSEETIQALKEQITEFYRSKNAPFVVVSVPKQEFSKDTLQIVVTEARLGKITSVGNNYFPTRWLSEMMRTSPGDPIRTDEVLEDLAWLNLNPFRRTDAIFKPGAKPGTADIELVTIDRWPYRMYMGGDNTGTMATNRNRLFFGFNFGKSVLKDGQISYQFTFAPNWNLFYAHTASARLPLPWRHIWVLWGGYTQVKPHTDTPNQKNCGISWQVDTRYRIPFFTTPKILQSFVVGYDFKETNDEIREHHVKVYRQSADINQFMVGYELGYRSEELRTSLVAELYGNPGGITYGNKTRFYEELRYRAGSHYIYFKLAHSFGAKSRWGWWTYDLSGQAASRNLLPSEQFTMTGYNAVRGYEERILNLDNALLVNLSYETPHFSPAKTFGLCKKWDELYFLAFFDYGLGANHEPTPTEERFYHLASVGPGVRYQIDRYFTARLDYGFQLFHSDFDNPTHSRYNFGVMLSY